MNNFIKSIKNLFYVSGEIDECEPELVYKLYVLNPQRKDDSGSLRSTYKGSLEIINGISFKVHSLIFKEELMVYEMVLINDDCKRKQDIHNCVITVYEEVELINLNSKEVILKPIFNIYSKRDAYKVLEHIYNRRVGIKNIKDPKFITKNKLIIEYLDIVISTTIEVKDKSDI